MSNEDVFVHLLNLPAKTNEIVSVNEDGTFSVFINAKLSNDGQLRAYKHALKHIKSGDFERQNVTASKIEMTTHQSKPIIISKNESSINIEKKIKTLQRRRKRTQSKLEKYEKERQVRESMIPDYEKKIFASWEYGRAYGDDL